MERLLQILNRMADALAAFLLAACFLLGVCSLFDVYQVYRKAEDTSFLEYKPVIQDDSSVVPAAGVPDDYVAWLSIDRTAVDYPVMQGADNFEYLNKAPGGEYALSGSIFLDAGNSADFSDPYSLIYGHHMEGGRLFGALDRFFDPAYFEDHRTGTLIVGEEIYHIEFFAALHTDASESAVFAPCRSSDITSYVREHAEIFYSPAADKVIGLSTCTSAATNERSVLFGSIYRRNP